jgi:hypothetical protein
MKLGIRSRLKPDVASIDYRDESKFQVLTAARLKTAAFFNIAPSGRRWRHCAPLKCRSTSTWLRSAISQKAATIHINHWHEVSGNIFCLMSGPPIWNARTGSPFWLSPNVIHETVTDVARAYSDDTSFRIPWERAGGQAVNVLTGTDRTTAMTRTSAIKSLQIRNCDVTLSFVSGSSWYTDTRHSVLTFTDHKISAEVDISGVNKW